MFEDLISDYSADLPLTGLEGISTEGALAEALAQLDPLYPMDCDACDAMLFLRPDRAQQGLIALDEAATSTRREDFGSNQGYSRGHSPNPDQPVRVLRYYDIDRDYQPGAQRASGRPLPGQPRAIDLPGALQAQAARVLVENAAKREDWARQSLSWRITQLDPAVRPGAKVSVPGHPGQWKIESWEWNDQGIELSLTRLAPLLTIADQADPGRANPAPDLDIGITQIAAFELPWDGNPSTSVPMLIAPASGSSPAWSGAGLFVDQGDGALQPLGPSGRARAILGKSTSALQPASPLLFDRHSSVTVRLVGEDLGLSDATMRQLAMGANRAILGQEIIQFASAVPLGGGNWRLSGLWRGRGGTENAIGGHQGDETFYLLDGSGTLLDSQIVGDAAGTLIAAIGQGDSQPATASVQLRGIGARPLAPVHGRLAVSGDGSAVLSWTCRARGAWQWLDGVDAPLNEQSEFYTVSFGSPSSPIMAWSTASPELALDTQTLSQLLSQMPTGQFMVRQRGDRGVSDPLTIPLS